MKTIFRNTIYRLISITLFCFTLLLSCIVSQTDGKREKGKDKADVTQKIIFLNYSANLDRLNGVVKIRLVNKFITEGTIKMDKTVPEISKPGDLKCFALNKKMEPIDSIIITDPLNITVESVDENNAFFKKEIALDSAEFSVRMQLSQQAQVIAIRKNESHENKDSYLLITKIKEP
jgi:hypothetical protein